MCGSVEMDNLSLFDDHVSIMGCSSCLCRECMLWWSSRCPHGECYDDYRSKANPYDKAHPNEPPRKKWTNWRTDQAYWCRGGDFYPCHACKDYLKYDGSKVNACLYSNVQIFQDGYIMCPIIDSVGCEECYMRFNDKQEV